LGDWITEISSKDVAGDVAAEDPSEMRSGIESPNFAVDACEDGSSAGSGGGEVASCGGCEFCGMRGECACGD